MRFYTIAAAAFICASQSHAQSVAQQIGADLRDGAKDVWAIYKAPFNGSGKDWATFGAIVAVSAASMVTDKPIEKWAQANDSAGAWRFLDPLRRGGWLFAGKYVVPPAAALYIIGLATNNQNLRDAMIGCAASWAGQSPPRKLFYRLVGRLRPETSPDDNQVWEVPNRQPMNKEGWQWRSMPSGHFANALGCATFLNNRFDMGTGWETLLYGVAIGVGVGRSLDHGHWMSDHVIGGAFGYAVGKEVARRSLARRMAASGPSITASPGALGGVSFNFNWRF